MIIPLNESLLKVGKFIWSFEWSFLSSFHCTTLGSTLMNTIIRPHVFNVLWVAVVFFMKSSPEVKSVVIKNMWVAFKVSEVSSYWLKLEIDLEYFKSIFKTFLERFLWITIRVSWLLSFLTNAEIDAKVGSIDLATRSYFENFSNTIYFFSRVPRRARLNGESQEGGKVLKMKMVTYVIGEGTSSVGCWLRGYLVVNDVRECGRVVVTLSYSNSKVAKVKPRLTSIPPNEADLSKPGTTLIVDSTK